jgi:endonuclease III
MKDNNINKIIQILKREVQKWNTPIVTRIAADRKKAPFKVLISCILSLRTKDETTSGATERLFNIAGSPEEMLRLSHRAIEEAIYPVGFYKTKAENIKRICGDLANGYNSEVPDEIDELLKFKGVGRKTANLVVTLGYGKPGICVDTHVHRISNRFGYIRTFTPKDTEFTLRGKLPDKYWIIYNDLLVAFGQNICKPISPFCSRCPIKKYCDRVGVNRYR